MATGEKSKDKINELLTNIKSSTRVDPDRIAKAEEFNKKLSMVTVDDLFRKFTI